MSKVEEKEWKSKETSEASSVGTLDALGTAFKSVGSAFTSGMQQMQAPIRQHLAGNTGKLPAPLLHTDTNTERTVASAGSVGSLGSFGALGSFRAVGPIGAVGPNGALGPIGALGPNGSIVSGSAGVGPIGGACADSEARSSFMQRCEAMELYAQRLGIAIDEGLLAASYRRSNTATGTSSSSNADQLFDDVRIKLLIFYHGLRCADFI